MLSVDDVKNKLAVQIVQPKKSFRQFLFTKYDDKSYEGTISGNGFTISRLINYRNSFLPVITGKIERNSPGETLIRIKMRPGIPVIIFMSFWLGIFAVIFLVVLFDILFEPKNIPGGFIAILGPITGFSFGWFLCFFSFKSESKKAKIFLAELFGIGGDTG